MSVEKLLHESYFIEYSWVTGDKSYLGLGLVIENTKREKLSRDDFKSVWIEDDRGNKYMPLPYEKILDFPKDRPLG